MEKVPAWAVAAALLLAYKNPEEGFHISELTKMVKETELSGLGVKGFAPEQSLRQELDCHRSYWEGDDVRTFEQPGRGQWRIADAYIEAAKNEPDVRIAIRGLREIEKHKELVKKIEMVENKTNELQTLIAEIKNLLKK